MQSLRKTIFMALDVAIIVLSFSISFVFSSQDQIINSFMTGLQNYMPLIIMTAIIGVFSNYINGIYNTILRFAGIHDLVQICKSVALTTVLSVVFNFAIGGYADRSLLFFTFLLIFFFTVASRISLRILNRITRFLFSANSSKIRLLVIGAGISGATVVSNLHRTSDSKYHVVGIIDDNPMKTGARIHGVKVLGNRNTIGYYVKELNVDEVLIAIPSADRQSMTEIFEICSKTGISVKIMPRLDEFESGEEGTIYDARNINIEDLLGRKEVDLDIESISSYLTNETVLVTGGGGSIGSELCRQIARFSPAQIVVYDIYENNSYELQMEFQRKYGNRIKLIIAIGSVRDKQRLDYVFETFKPGVVFHAAAHKHVPLMENDPGEAVKNNVFGTINTMDASERNDVKRFILVSTDKAVNPTNVMGASKRLCEMVLQDKAKKSKTVFAAVRFGNVLGSNGSVIPLFTNQILEGGPITVTHEEITRYFMTIPEAAKLVIQAGALAQGGEIYVLDMGEPVKIKDLAEDLIRLYGKEPYKDIMIEYVGLRPGEKLYEELMMTEEGSTSTKHASIFVCRALDVDSAFLEAKLIELFDARNNKENTIRILKEMIPTYVQVEYADLSEEMFEEIEIRR
ncbi:MAG: nucleoside-diphosphate sugar epimerase/dehydratase [Clostridia bacterium]